MAPSLSKKKPFIKYTPFFLCKTIYVLCSNERIESKINSCTKLACQLGCTMTSNNTSKGEVKFWSRKSFPKTKKTFFPGRREKVMNKSGGKYAFQKWPRTSVVLYHKTAMRRGKMVADGRWQNSVNFNCRSSNGHARAGMEDNAHLCTMYAKCPWESFLMARGAQKRRLARSIFGPWTAHKLLFLCGKISFHLFFFQLCRTYAKFR